MVSEVELSGFYFYIGFKLFCFFLDDIVEVEVWGRKEGFWEMICGWYRGLKSVNDEYDESKYISS